MSDCACDVIAFPPVPERDFSFFLELTPECTNACRGCSNVFVRNRAAPPLGAKQWERILGKLAPGNPRLKLTGGEPTLHPEFRRIVERISHLGMRFTLFTNGRWRDPDQLITFLRARSGMEALLISLHGPDAESHQSFTARRDSFAETKANICRATAAGLRVVISTVLTTYNYTRTEEMLILARALGATRIVFNRYIGFPIPGLVLDEPRLLQAVQKLEALGEANHGWVGFGTPIPRCFAPNSSNGCWAGRLHLAIDPWGNVHPCTHSEESVGNLLTDELEEIRMDSTLKSWQRVPQECSGCSFRARCRGGCRVMARLAANCTDPLLWRVPSRAGHPVPVTN